MNLVIDGNAFLNVAISIVKNILKEDPRVGEIYYVPDLMEEDTFMLKTVSKEKFRSFSVNYFGSILASIKEDLSSVFFVFDSKSWRKKFIKDHFDLHKDSDFNYKGQRKYDDKMYLFFELFQNEILRTISEEYGVSVIRVNGAEGDDLIAYVCETLHEDICIWTVDKDLTQLVESGDRKVIVIMPKQMTKYKKLYTSELVEEKALEPQPFDLLDFDLDSISKPSMNSMVSNLIEKGYKHFVIDPTSEILEKFLAGDSSDNIPRIHPKMTAAKVEKSIETIKAEYANQNVLKLIDSGEPAIINRICEVACESLKIKDPGERQTILNNLNLNKSIIRLHTAFFPEEVMTAIRSTVDLSNRRKFDYYKFKKITSTNERRSN